MASLLVALLASGQLVSAQGRMLGTPIVKQPLRGDPIRLPRDERSIGAFVPTSRTTKATVHGIVQNHLGELVPLAGMVVLRSLVTGQAVATAPVDELATFVVKGFEPGVYSAELVSASGSVIASSQSFTAGIGEVIGITPIIPGNTVAGIAQLLNTSSAATASVVNSAMSAGVLAIDSGILASP